jgi:hypothetical protein
MGRVSDRVTRPPVLTVFAVLQAFILALLVTAHMAARMDPAQTPEDPGTGDFGAFFTGGAMVKSGRGAELYDFSAQRSVQDEYLGEGRDYWQPYLNPPALAMALAPTTGLGYVASFRIFAAALSLILGSALLFLKGATPGINRTRLSTVTALLLTMGFLPVALTTFGGQNTALTLGLLCGIYAAVRLKHPVVAGVLLGVLTYKPQFVLIVGVVFLLQRQFATVAVAALVGLLHYGLGAGVSGVGWPLDYLAALAEHGPLETAQNGVWHFSLPAVVGRLFPGWGGAAVTTAGMVGILGLLVGAGRRLSVDSPGYPAFFGMVVAGTMLLTPHLQYYEVGILALPALLGVETILAGKGTPSLGLRVFLAAGYFSYPLWKLSETLPVQPFFFLLLAVFFWSRHLVVEPQRTG